MCPALIAEEERVTLRKVACSFGLAQNFHQSAVAVLAESGRDSLGDYSALRVAADVNHLGARVCLLVIVCDGYRVELACGVVTAQDT